eukprot:scaffold55519_cov36-Tisochrysis_lutea.AAC.3
MFIISRNNLILGYPLGLRSVSAEVPSQDARPLPFPLSDCPLLVAAPQSRGGIPHVSLCRPYAPPCLLPARLSFPASLSVPMTDVRDPQHYEPPACYDPSVPSRHASRAQAFPTPSLRSRQVLDVCPALLVPPHS